MSDEDGLNDRPGEINGFRVAQVFVVSSWRSLDHQQIVERTGFSHELS